MQEFQIQTDDLQKAKTSICPFETSSISIYISIYICTKAADIRVPDQMRIQRQNNVMQDKLSGPKKGQTLEIVSAGLHCSLRISRQMLPLLLIFGWKTLVLNATWKHEITVSILLQQTIATHTDTTKQDQTLHIRCMNYLRGLERIIRRKMNGD